MSKVIACAAVALCLLGLGATAAVTADEKAVQITDKGFVPDKIEVLVGESVVWKNATTKEHTVTARGKAPGGPEFGQEGKDKPLFDSGPIKPGASWQYTFTKEGTYEYMCQMEKSMVGTIVVKPAK